MPASPTSLVPTALVLFFGWRVFRRVRRNIGRQPLRTIRMVTRIVIYTVLTLALGTFAFLFGGSNVLAGLAGGLVLGAGLGLFGVHLTRFEVTDAGRFYTPNRYIGVGVSMLLVARLVYRVIVYSGIGNPPAMQPQIMQSPLTLFLFGLLAGYYMAYFAGVLFRGSKLAAS